MFDPTVFENLKVAFENHLYDLDNLDERILITGRTDRMEMSVLSREFALEFRLTGEHAEKGVKAQLHLTASIQDLASEILETPDAVPGCTLRLRFELLVHDVTSQCGQIEQALKKLWPDQRITQSLSYVYGATEAGKYTNVIELVFDRKINEEQMQDIPELAEHIILTIQELSKLASAPS